MVLHEAESCEVCEEQVEDLVLCEGVLVCEPCATLYGSELAQYRDQLREDLAK